MSEDRQAALERAYEDALIERELVAVLATYPITPHALRQLVNLWRGDFIWMGSVDACYVLNGEGQTIAQAVDVKLSSPEYAHFLQSRRTR